MFLNKFHSLDVANLLVTSRKMGSHLARELLEDRKASKMPTDGKLGTHSQLAHSSTLHPEEAIFFPVSFSFTRPNGARPGGSEKHLLASRQRKILAL